MDRRRFMKRGTIMLKRAGILLSVLFSADAGSCPTQGSSSMLARILAGKGVIDSAELARVEAASPESRVQVLASLLEEKGVLTRAELAKLTPPAEPAAVLATYQTPAPAQPMKPAEQAGAQAAPPVTGEKKFPITVYGTLLLNAFSNTALTNIEDIPLFNA